MAGGILIDPGTTLPGAFVFFLTAGVAICVVVEWTLGRRWGEPALAWAALIAAGIFGAVVGSKLYMSQLGAWSPALAAGALPVIHGKNLLGAVAGTLVAVWGLRWLLGSRARFADALGLALPVAILVGRAGCLFTGCCHGTVSDVPWAMRYGAGSVAHGHHVADGLLHSGAATSLAIHPAQLYEMLLVLPLVVLVFRLRGHLRRDGSLLLVTIIGYGVIRCAQEFFRYGGEPIGGLKPVQWGLLMAILVSGTALWWREGRPAVRREGRGLSDLRAGVLAGLGALGAWMTLTWFGPGERFCVLLACMPLAWHAVEAVSQAVLPSLSPGWRRVVPTGFAVAALAAWVPQYKVEKKPAPHANQIRVDLGGGVSQEHYELGGCGDGPPEAFTDHGWAFQGTVAYQRHFSDRQYVETGVSAYGGVYGRTTGPSSGGGWFEPGVDWPLPGNPWGAKVPFSVRGAETYGGYDGYWWSIYGGFHIYGIPELGGGPWVMGSGSLRLGPRDLVFLEGRAMHDMNVLTESWLQWGLGITMGPVGTLRMGLANVLGGFYLEPDVRIPLDHGMLLTLSPGFWVDFHDPSRTGGFSFSGGLQIPLD